MDVEKKIVLGILKKERLSSGLLMIGNNGKLRFEILKPQTNLSILDGKNAWLIENPDEKELPVRVIKSSGDNYKKSQSILMLAFGKGDIDEFFDLDSKSLENNIGSYVFTSKEKSFEVKKLQIFIDTKALVIQAIHYWDNLNNKTELSFKNTEFLNKMSENNFKYTAPKNAEITILK